MNPPDLLKSSLNKIKAIYTDVLKAQDMAKQDRRRLASPPFLLDAKHRQCPLDIISPVDLARHELLKRHIPVALALSKALEDFRVEVSTDIDAFIEVSNNQHKAKIGVIPEDSKRQKWKGNIQLTNHNATQKIDLRIHDRIAFNEGLNLAMEKINGLIRERSGELDEILKVLVEDAFKVDQRGYVDVKKVLDLRRHKIKHPVWIEAMQDINDSIRIDGSRSYLKFAYRDTPESDWVSISLDIANAGRPKEKRVSGKNEPEKASGGSDGQTN